jgi:hypothetical protein
MSRNSTLPEEEQKEHERLIRAVRGPIYEADETPWIAFASWYLVFLLLVPSLIFGIMNIKGAKDPNEPVRKIKEIVIAGWALGVPIWFAIEHWFIYRKYGRPEAFDQFKHQQELISRVWLAAIAVLTALFFGFPGKA